MINIFNNKQLKTRHSCETCPRSSSLGNGNREAFSLKFVLKIFLFFLLVFFAFIPSTANPLPPPPVPPPTVNPVTSPTTSQTITLSGTKQAGTAIYINGIQYVPLNGYTTWQTTYTLQPGTNTLSITAKDPFGNQSPAVTIQVIFVIPPSPPTVNPVASPTTSQTITLSGTKQAGTAIYINGIQYVPLNSYTTWQTTYTLQQGTNTLSITAKDLYGYQSQAVTIQVVYVIPPSPPTVNPVPSTTTSQTITLSGTKQAGTAIYINGVEFVPLDSSTTWSGMYTLQSGTNTLNITAKDAWGYSSDPVVVTVTYQIAPQSTPIGQWHMDNNWNDSSGNGNNGTAYNGATFSTDAKIGTHAGSFDGVDDYVSGTNTYISAATNTFTIEFWSKPTATRNITIESNSGISGIGGQRYAISPAWFGNSDAGVGVSVGTNGISVFEHAADYLPSPLVYNVSLSGWNHIAVVYESKQPRLYLNGNLVRTGLNSQRSNVFPSIKFGNIGNYGPYQGLLDEVAVYNRALSASEIKAHYDAGTVVEPPPPPPVTVSPPTVNPVTSPTTSQTITLSGTKQAGTAIYINGVEYVPLNSSTTWQTTYTLQSGTNTLNIVAKDANGNQSSAVVVTVLLDNTAPTISSSIPANNVSVNTTITSVTINLTDSYSNINLTATITGAVVKNSSGQAITGTWTTSGNSTVIFTPSSPFIEGTYTVTIYPTDTLGNKGTGQITFSYDTTAPPLPTINPVISLTNQSSQTITGTKSSDTSTIIVTSSTATIGTVSYPTNTTWSVNVSNLKEGTNTLSILAKDSNGNQSQAVVVEIIFSQVVCPTIYLFEGCRDTLLYPPGGRYISFGYRIYLVDGDEEIAIKRTERNGQTVTVKTLHNGISDWDGITDNGKLVPPGRYTATMTLRKTGCEDVTSDQDFPVSFTVTFDKRYSLLYIDFASSASVASGNLYHSQTLFNIPNSKILGDFNLSYNSLDGYNGPLGIGWTHTYNINLSENNDDSYTLMEGDGTREVLYPNGSSYAPKTSSYPILTKNTDSTYTLTHKDGTIYTFNSNGKITAITDRNSNALTFNYDTNNNLTNITDPSGRVISLNYDSDNRINTITDPNNNTHTFTYTNDTLTGISTMSYELTAKSWSFTYDSNAFMLTKTDPQGYTTTYTYDENHRVTEALDSEGKTKSITYPSQIANTDTIKTTTVTEKDGGNWTYKYDTTQGTLTEKTDPEGNTTTYTYDSNKNMTSVTEPEGNVTSYTYDSENNMTSVKDAEGNITNYTYNSFGQVASITDSEDKTTTYSYDSKGNLTSTTDPSGATTQYQYDSKGNVTSITNADGQTTTFIYDEHSYLSSITDSTGATTTFTYDSAGNMISQTDPSGNTTTYTYDSLNRLEGVTDPQGNSSSFTYDLNGNRTSSTDSNGNVTYYEYNSKGQITKVTDALGNVMTYEYGNTDCSSASSGCSSGPDKLTSITDAGGNKTTYEYDLNGRLIKETDPEGKVITYSYDANGNLISKTTPDGITINYSYDSLNRLTDITFPDSTQNISYTYDSTGKIIIMTDPSGITDYIYDDSSRLTTKERMVDGTSFVTEYVYTAGGSLSTITYPSGRTISYVYDENGRVIKVTETKDGKTNDIITNVVYNTNGTVSRIDYANGIITTKEYDVKGALSNLNIGMLRQLSYTHDNIGNITAITDLLDSTKTKTFAYDALYRLTNAIGPWGTISYNYDPVGNRLMENSYSGATNYSYTANRLISTTGAKTYTFGYDDNGNTISELETQNSKPLSTIKTNGS